MGDVPESGSLSGFEKWLPFRNVHSSYWFIAQTKGVCWKCHKATLRTSILLPEGRRTLETSPNENEPF